MNIQARKLKVIEYLIRLNDETALHKIELAIDETQKEPIDSIHLKLFWRRI